ncbi:MAG TPA: diguanylate cyclase [Burkholderiales bacterium]|nr:diguanylate cyclase [Burkholderiales bacterium]
MSELTNPSDIARETLRLLASRRIAPTPDSYRQHYQEIAGQPDTDRKTSASDWAQLILDLLRQWETRHIALTTARKRESLERVLGVPGSDPARLAAKLRSLVASWSMTAPAEEPDMPVEPPAAPETISAKRPPAAQHSASVDGTDDGLAELRELLAQTLEFAVVSHLGNAPDLAEEANAMAKDARAAAGKDAIAQLTSALRRFWYKLEVRGGDNAELHQGLLRLLRLLIDNTHELLSEDRWLRGQVAVVQEIVTRPLDLGAVVEAERRLKEVIFKQGTLRHSLQEAKAALKQLITNFIGRLGDLSESTGGYHDRLEGYAQKIRQTDDITQLNVVLADLLADTRAAQLDAVRTRDELLAARRQVEAAETKVKALERELEQVSELVQEDQLTGVLNRRGLEDACARETARSERTGAPLCIALLDIDNFKHLNDAHGHQTGDEALQHLVRVTKRTMRPSDVLARYGGEEFMLLLPDTQQQEAVEVMVRLQRNLTKAFFLHNNERVLITFSAGVALRQSGEPQAGMIARADKALYEAKRSGKNRVCAA